MRHCLLLALPLALFSPSFLAAQKQDPKALELLEHARQMTLATAKGLPAYKLEASFETFDEKGVSDGVGTLVQTALPDGHRRQTVTYRGRTLDSMWFNTVHRVADKEYEETLVLRSMLNALTNTLPSQAELLKRNVQIGTENSGLKMDCAVVSIPPHDEGKKHSATQRHEFCMDATNGMLRMVVVQGGGLVLNRFRKLGSAYVPGDVQITQDGVKRAGLTVNHFATDPTLTVADFELARTNGKADTSRIIVDTDTVLEKTQPTYPPSAVWSSQRGTVAMKAIIGTDGLVKDVNVVSSPSALLADSASEAVRQWRYEPYLVDSEPIEVEASVSVNYAIGR
ncbi:energy transducer TonB [Terriglobus roseus]|uniref:TonB family C-terminal domain-containing protein n=1 Tax=Terriglobus roseus TaxID=392734 RepID=A0A1G7Q923_9BACT|nr:energy transducer TonB [Terriglobus roseus]SDF94974.1 TonB family C-terminal domain-containing protein [Terriglobus roseus]